MARSTTNRPMFSRSIVELETYFENNRTDARKLKVLAAELVHRQTERATKLAARVEQALLAQSLTVAAAPEPGAGVFAVLDARLPQ